MDIINRLACCSCDHGPLGLKRGSVSAILGYEDLDPSPILPRRALDCLTAGAFLAFIEPYEAQASFSTSIMRIELS